MNRFMQITATVTILLLLAYSGLHGSGIVGGNVYTTVALTANLPVIGVAGSRVTVGTRSGNTSQYVTTTGSQTFGACVQIDASGNHIATGSACGSGGGGVATPNQIFPFTTQTSVTMTHNLGTTAILVQCMDAGTPAVYIDWNSLTFTNINTATVTFTGAQSGSCIINGGGGSGVNITAESVSFTVDATDGVMLCSASGGAVVATLPAAATAGAGREYTMKKVDATVNSCTFDGNAAETIDGAATLPNTVRYQSFTIVSDGSTWWVI
jgi:hypothetical protein